MKSLSIQLLCLLITIHFFVSAGRPIKFIFSHGLGGNYTQVNYYNATYQSLADFAIVDKDCITFDYPEVTPINTGDKDYKNYTIDSSKVNLGQDNDIAALRKACEPYLSEFDLVLVGLSRGAATIINYASLYPENIKALVIESPFDDIETTVGNKLKQFFVGWIPGSRSLGHTLFARNYPNYKKNGIKPIDSISKINKDIPMLFVHSKNDKLIDMSASKRLYKKRKAMGCTNINFVTLSDASHGSYMALEKDRIKYQKGVNSFYKEHGITIN